MARQKVGRNESCPCGIGKKYKTCCWDKRFSYVRDESGTILKQVPFGPEVGSILEEQRRKFVEKFGREPGPEDLVFFDADSEDVKAQTVEAMRKAKISPMLIYAYEQTGLIVTEGNRDLISESDLDEWNEACDEWEEMHDRN